MNSPQVVMVTLGAGDNQIMTNAADTTRNHEFNRSPFVNKNGDEKTITARKESFDPNSIKIVSKKKRLVQDDFVKGNFSRRGPSNPFESEAEVGRINQPPSFTSLEQQPLNLNFDNSMKQ